MIEIRSENNIVNRAIEWCERDEFISEKPYYSAELVGTQKYRFEGRRMTGTEEL